MKLEDFRKAYQELSGKASDAARQLAFAGIAIVWIFRNGDGLQSKIPDELVLPIGLFATSLGCDLLHYVVSALIWSVFTRTKELKGATDDQEVDAPPYLNWAALGFYWAKLGLILVGYAYMIEYLWRLWRP